MNTFMRGMRRMIACIDTMANTDYDLDSKEFDEECAKRATQIEEKITETVKNMDDDDIDEDEEENSGIIGRIKAKLHLGSNDDDEDDDE